MVRKLLVVDPKERMSIDEALQHPWLQVTPAADPDAIGLFMKHKSHASRWFQDQEMLATAKRLMYPNDATHDPAPVAMVTPTQQEALSASGDTSHRKREREEDDEEHPAKRSQTVH